MNTKNLVLFSIYHWLAWWCEYVYVYAYINLNVFFVVFFDGDHAGNLCCCSKIRDLNRTRIMRELWE